MKFLSIVLAVMIMVSSCATLPYEPYAREVKKRPRSGGVIALKINNRPEDRMKAESLMRYNCGNEHVVKVVEEGEVVVGEETNSSSSKNTYPNSGLRLGSSGFSFGAVETDHRDTHSTTNQIREWQLSYECVASKDETIQRKSKNYSKK